MVPEKEAFHIELEQRKWLCATAQVGMEVILEVKQKEHLTDWQKPSLLYLRTATVHRSPLHRDAFTTLGRNKDRTWKYFLFQDWICPGCWSRSWWLVRCGRRDIEGLQLYFWKPVARESSVFHHWRKSFCAARGLFWRWKLCRDFPKLK